MVIRSRTYNFVLRVTIINIVSIKEKCVVYK